MSFDSPRQKRTTISSGSLESKNTTGSISLSESTKFRKLRRKRSQIVRNSLRGSIPLLADNLFPNLPQFKIKQAEKRATQKSLPSIVTSKALAVAENRRAKTVFFYRDGDEYFTGVRVPITKGRFRTMDALMDSLNESIPMPFGVRRLHTPSGKTPIRSLDELKPHGRYIAASSTRRVQGVDLEAIERRKRHREDAQRRWNFQNSPTTATHGGNSANLMQIIQINPKSATSEINSQNLLNNQREQMFQTSGETVLRSRGEKLPTASVEASSLSNQQRVNTFMPVTSKQIYFVLNGNPHRFYRTLVSPLRRGELDHLLEEISEGLHVAIFRIYSFEGDRILNVEQLLQLKDSRAIAVPRHERLILNGQTNSDILRPVIPIQTQKQQQQLLSTGSLLLPPIKNSNNQKSNKGSTSKSVPPYYSKNRQPSNNIDRLPAYENISNNIARFENNSKKKRILHSTNSIDNNDHKSIKPQETSIRQRSFSSNNAIAPPLASSALNAIKVKRKLTAIGPTNTINTIVANTNTSSTNTTITTNSDSGRPRSAMEELENMATEENEVEQEIKENEEDAEEDDYPEEPPELKALHQVIQKKKRKKSSKEKNKEEIEENEEKEEEKDEKTNQNEVEEEEDKNIDIVRNETQETIKNGTKENEEDIEENNYLEEPSELVIYNDNNNVEIGEIKDDGNNGTENDKKEEKIISPKMTEEEMQINPHIQFNDDNTEQTNEGDLSGIYSEELEHILYGQAAIKIQSAWRGYNVRKGFKHTRFSDYPTYIGTSNYGPRRRSKNNLYKPNERHQAIVTRVKTPISGKRGTASFRKKSSTTMLIPDYGNETAHDSSSDREEASVTELLQGKQRLGWEMSQEQNDRNPVNTQRTPRTDYFYTITVLTGNRWAADTEADLYVIMHGTGGIESERLWLRQEFTNWLQSGTNGQRFRQNHSDSFQFRVPNRFGILKKLTIGHDSKGYGAGIFIDRIMVTEDEEASDDCRQFLFLCNKWLDSGQVDGKLERTIRLNSFYEISSIPIEDRVTKGRWELILHGGSEKGLGGTTSQLSITGYGTRAQSVTSGLYDSNMAKVPSYALIQLDFGDIGELLKVRIEIDGSGKSPDYFLNFVEFKDLDTEERFVVMCGKWLRWKSTRKGDQPFRELSAFHIGVEPLPLITYEGKISVQSIPRIECFNNKEVLMDLHGDLGETGIFRILISPTDTNKEKKTKSGDEENIPIIGENESSENIDIPFKVEVVSIGRVLGARLRFEPNQIGEQIVDGLLIIQSLFQKQGLWPLTSNSEFLCGRILLRESYHTPYRYILTRSQFHELSEKTQCTKEMLTTEMEGVSTRLPRRKQMSRKMPNWLLQISLSYGSTLLPEIELCGENGSNIRLRSLDKNCSDGMLSYQIPPQSKQNIEDNDQLTISPLRKIRIFIEDEAKKLTGLENNEETTVDNNNEEQKPFTIVEKIRICDSINGDELRFPAADCHLQKHSVYELSVIWPDRPPIPIIIYLVRIVAGGVVSPQNMPTITVRLNISGEYGDVGWRTLNNSENEHYEEQKSLDNQQQIQLFAPNTRNSFEFEAVSIGHLDFAEMEVFCSEAQDFSWECTELIVTDTNTAQYYRFRFDSPFSTNCRLQRCQTLL